MASSVKPASQPARVGASRNIPFHQQKEYTMDARSTALSSFKYSTISVYFDTTWNMFSYYIYIFVGIDVISTFFIELIIFKEVYLRTTLEIDPCCKQETI